jgi:hypothetical protein
MKVGVAVRMGHSRDPVHLLGGDLSGAAAEFVGADHGPIPLVVLLEGAGRKIRRELRGELAEDRLARQLAHLQVVQRAPIRNGGGASHPLFAHVRLLEKISPGIFLGGGSRKGVRKK